MADQAAIEEELARLAKQGKPAAAPRQPRIRAGRLGVALEPLADRHAKPRLKLYHAWLVKTRAAVPDGTGTAKAIDYPLNRWPALSRYADSGHLPIDNNPVENAIRPIAIGKKNWLFAGSARGRMRTGFMSGAAA